jgi:hypothetical protein
MRGRPRGLRAGVAASDDDDLIVGAHDRPTRIPARRFGYDAARQQPP